MDARRIGPEDLEALWRRLVRVARLDVGVFLEAGNDSTSTLPALAIVVGATLLAGIGGWLLYLLIFPAVARDGVGFFLSSAIVGSIAAIALWFAWVFVTMVVLQALRGRQVSFLALVRTMGFAYFPIALEFILFISPLATPIGVIALAATVVFSDAAVETVTGARRDQALIATLAGFAVYVAVLALLGRGAQYYAPGLFAFSI